MMIGCAASTGLPECDERVRVIAASSDERPGQGHGPQPGVRSGLAESSHLFSQALVSAQALATSPDARAIFTAKVRAHPHGRDLPADFQPKKVIFAILLKNGENLTADILFPFSQVTLASTARELESRYQIPVEVIGIEAERA